MNKFLGPLHERPVSFGASGARILGTLLHEMKRRGAAKCLATLCIGGGMGIAIRIEQT